MAYYMFQGRYTTESIRAMVENPQDREKAAKALIEVMGGKLHSMFFAFGNEDIIAIIEVPDDKTAAAAALAIGAGGAFSSGATTKLMTTAEAMDAMGHAQKAVANYTPPAG
ncbi:MAG: GYD domain-containing protein [Pseudomonadota bacterium]